MNDTFEFHEKWKNPETGGWCKHVYLLNGKRMTGVTTVLGVIGKNLTDWASRVGVSAAFQLANQMEQPRLRKLSDILSKFQNISKEQADGIDFDEFQEARNTHLNTKESAGDKGTDVHALVEEYIKRCIEVNDGNAQDILADSDPMLKKFVGWALDNGIKFLDSEKRVFSKEWFVAGTFDFSFEKDGKRYIGDLKTMKKMWDRVPFFQTAAYRKMSIEMGEAPYDGSCIVNINKETNELTEYWTYDWENDQKAFEAALTLYRQLTNF